MGRLFVKNGTPVGSEHLCKGCTWGQFTTGYRESDVLVICTNTNPNLKLPFPVHECSEYADKSMPDWQQMEKLAIELAPAQTLRKTPGFRVAHVAIPGKPSVVEPDDEDIGEEIACR